MAKYIDLRSEGFPKWVRETIRFNPNQDGTRNYIPQKWLFEWKKAISPPDMLSIDVGGKSYMAGRDSQVSIDDLRKWCGCCFTGYQPQMSPFISFEIGLSGRQLLCNVTVEFHDYWANPCQLLAGLNIEGAKVFNRCGHC